MSMMIYVECKPDTTLLTFLGFKAHHAMGKSRVCQHLERHTYSVGIVDEDPGSNQPSYVTNLMGKSPVECEKFGLRILRDNQNDNLLIIIRPRLEEWILKAADESGLELENYGLPNDPINFHSVIHHELNKFQKLLNDLKKRRNSRLQKLVKLINSI